MRRIADSSTHSPAGFGAPGHPALERYAIRHAATLLPYTAAATNRSRSGRPPNSRTDVRRPAPARSVRSPAVDSRGVPGSRDRWIPKTARRHAATADSVPESATGTPPASRPRRNSSRCGLRTTRRRATPTTHGDDAELGGRCGHWPASVRQRNSRRRNSLNGRSSAWPQRSTLLRRHASARQPLARALGYIDPLLAAGIHLGLACAGVGGTRAVVLSGLGHAVAFLHVGLVGSERGRRYCRRSECQQTADGRNRRIRLLHRFSPWVIGKKVAV